MWEARYGAPHYVFGTEPNDFLRDQLATLPPGRVLCLAEGEGRNAVFLAEAGFEVHSIDLTEAGVAKTLQLAADRGVTVHARVGDLAAAALGENEWDAIVSISGDHYTSMVVSIMSCKDRQYVPNTKARGGTDYDRNVRAGQRPLVRCLFGAKGPSEGQARCS